MHRLDRFAPQIAAALLVATYVQMVWRGWVLVAVLVFVVGAVAGIVLYLPRDSR